jgi:hypothetical protein
MGEGCWKKLSDHTEIALCFCATVFAHEMAPKAMVLRGGIEV